MSTLEGAAVLAAHARGDHDVRRIDCLDCQAEKMLNVGNATSLHNAITYYEAANGPDQLHEASEQLYLAVCAYLRRPVAADR